MGQGLDDMHFLDDNRRITHGTVTSADSDGSMPWLTAERGLTAENSFL